MKKAIVILFLVRFFISNGQVLTQPYTEKKELAKNSAHQFLVKEQIPGMAISVSKKGELIWSEGFGYSNIDLKTKVVPGVTQFRLASISKPITAVGLGLLVDKGIIEYNESVYKYLPNFPKKKYDFTVKQVGGHIGGIRHYNGNEFVLNKKMSITEGISIFQNDSLLHQPGTKYRYSTYGWNLISEIMQKASNIPFNEFMIDHLFTPLKMNSTRLDTSDKEMSNRTQFYRKTNANKIVLGPKVSNEHKVAGGGFVSTSEDIIRFGNEIINPTTISKKSLAELLESQKTSDGKSTNYGIGFVIGKTKNDTPIYSHSGGGIGATTLFLIYPKEEIVIVLLTNLSQVPIRNLAKKLENIFID